MRAACVRHARPFPLFAKRLAENDNSKQQVYLGHGFDALNLIPFGAVQSDSSKKHRCSGRLKVIASIEDPEVIAHILAHLDRTSGTPEPQRMPLAAQAPPWQSALL